VRMARAGSETAFGDTVAMARILLVDDEASVRNVFGALIEQRGHEVDTAANGKEALVLATQRSYDVIVTDVAMPELDGISFLRALRTRDLDVPVLMVTGSPSLQSAISAVEYGAFRYLTKPVDSSVLIDAITRALRFHQLTKLRREALLLVSSDTFALGDRAALEARFDLAMSTLQMAFQPIVSLKQRTVIGYEAFLRNAEKTLAHPSHFLEAARRIGRLPQLGRAVRRMVAQAAAQAPSSARIFMNLHPSDLNDPDMTDPAAPLSAMATRVVLEVTERASLDEVSDPLEKVWRLRELGFRVAVDDLGAGFAGLSSFAELEPDLVKLDMSLVRDVGESSAKQRVVHAMAQLCADMSVPMVVEGVETAAERDQLLKLGCDLCQGFLFARPAFSFDEPNPSAWP
jgi:EAL domain-containing protein (putative c-di-GMP-specific phosphodiesterase class I)/CheY-like chemotaxis protein